MNTEKGRRAHVWRCTVTGEFVVKFYRESASSEAEGQSAPRWVWLRAPTDYFTDDKADAYGTAENYVR